MAHMKVDFQGKAMNTRTRILWTKDSGTWHLALGIQTDLLFWIQNLFFAQLRCVKDARNYVIHSWTETELVLCLVENNYVKQEG